MTLESFQDLQKLSVDITGEDVCVPAALDMISEHQSLPLSFYEKYNACFMEQEESGTNGHHTRQTYRQLLGLLGSACFRNLQYERAESEDTLAQRLEKARQGGKRVLVNTEDLHVVGLKLTEEEKWTLHGTWGPWPTNTGIGLTVNELFPLLDQPPRYHWKNRTYKEHNMLIFPSEGKKR